MKEKLLILLMLFVVVSISAQHKPKKDRERKKMNEITSVISIKRNEDIIKEHTFNSLLNFYDDATNRRIWG